MMMSICGKHFYIEILSMVCLLYFNDNISPVFYILFQIVLHFFLFVSFLFTLSYIVMIMYQAI